MYKRQDLHTQRLRQKGLYSLGPTHSKVAAKGPPHSKVAAKGGYSLGPTGYGKTTILTMTSSGQRIYLLEPPLPKGTAEGRYLPEPPHSKGTAEGRYSSPTQNVRLRNDTHFHNDELLSREDTLFISTTNYQQWTTLISTKNSYHAAEAASIPRCGMDFFSRSQRPLQTLLQCPYTPTPTPRATTCNNICVHVKDPVVQTSVDYENTKTPNMHRRLGSATLSQLAFP